MSAETPVGNESGKELIELWQEQKLEGERMSIEEVRNRAATFAKKIRFRNAAEYAAAVIVVVSFGFQAFTAPNVFLRIGAELTVLATFYVVFTLRVRGSAQMLPEELGHSASLDFYRSSLERQRNLLQGIWRWYLLPFVPGVLLSLVGFAVRDGVLFNPARTTQNYISGVGIGILAAVFVGVFFFIARLNHNGARKIQKEIESLGE